MGVRQRLAVWIGSRSWAPRFLPQIFWLDTHFQRLTRGRWGFVDLAGLPSLTLLVRGRKSGLLREVPLLCVPYDPDGGGATAWLIGGSAFGAEKPPAWVANLRAAGEVTVRWRRRELPASWRELEGAERERAWAAMVRAWPNYERYAERAGRVIPVFLLRPA